MGVSRSSALKGYAGCRQLELLHITQHSIMLYTNLYTVQIGSPHPCLWQRARWHWVANANLSPMIRKPNRCLLYGSVGESGATQHESEAGERGPSSDAESTLTWMGRRAKAVCVPRVGPGTQSTCSSATFVLRPHPGLSPSVNIPTLKQAFA